MNFKIILSLILLLFLIGCKQLEEPKKKIIKTEHETTTELKTIKKEVASKPSDEIEEDNSKYIFNREYTNQGFALIYDENFFNEKNISKKLNNRGLFIFHTKIRKNSFVKITNPKNTKTVIAQVISNNAIFSNFYNSVITKRIVDELLLDENEPYVELSLISNESTFVAKKAKTFDEEKKVAQKAPVDGITIDNLGTKEKKELPKTTQSNFLYSIKIADFYYKDSAENMIQRIKDETKITNPVIKKLSQTKYRVLLGPFNDIKKIQESFEEIEKLNFENLKIIKDV
ncbi:SPOR domain-containing protein [Candidatus Pelagibacter sp.]|uniref:SPOR domain-containing protein n=1 Tax=Candidatus Pelagibacter sp. TaxID=2024849 RepID=UPI003D0A3AA7